MTPQQRKALLSKIIQVDFPDDQYYKAETEKTQIVIHHTVSGVGADGDLRHWLGSRARVATHIIIGRKGEIYQCYSSKYWGHHLGVKTRYLQMVGFTEDYGIRNKILNQGSIGIELDNWGGLTEKEGKFYTWTGKIIPRNQVEQYPDGFRGHYAFEKYTKPQLTAMANLLKFWHDRYDIPLRYHKDMWDISKKALAGTPGVWAHVSYRPDKSDPHPDPLLIKTLKSLT